MLLQAVMRLNATGFTNPLAGVRGMVGSTIGRLTALAGSAISVGAAFRGIGKAIELGGGLTDLRDVTGLTISDLVVLRQALDDTGVGAENTRNVISFMQKALAGVNEKGEPTNKIFEQLGVNLDEIRGKTPLQQVSALGKAIGGLKTEAQKTDAAMKIFGDSGARMKTFFADQRAIDKAREGLGTLPDDLARNANRFDEIGDRIGRLRTRMSGVWLGMAEAVTTELFKIEQGARGIDSVGFGRAIGEQLRGLIKDLRDCTAFLYRHATAVKAVAASYIALRAAGAVGGMLKANGIGAGAGLGISKATGATALGAAGAVGVGVGLGILANTWIRKRADDMREETEASERMVRSLMAQEKGLRMVVQSAQTAEQKDAARLKISDAIAAAQEKMNEATPQQLDYLEGSIMRMEKMKSFLGPETKPGAETPDAVKALGSGSKVEIPSVSQSAKAGMYVSNAAFTLGPSIDFARRTAFATEKAAEWLRQIAAAGRRGSNTEGMQAAWA